MPDAPTIALSAAAPGVAWLTLEKQATRNALDWEALELLEELVRQAESDRELGVLVIRSALERVFVAGADIGLIQALTPSEGARFAAAGQGLMERLEESRLVTIAAVGGFALGGGFELALACDLVVASEAAVFGLPETGIGLVPGFGGTQRLARAVSPQRAREVVLAGRRLTAAEARDWGLVNIVVPPAELAPAALALAEKVLAASPTAVAHAKRALVQGARAPHEQGLAIEALAWEATLANVNRNEGLSAFLEKRPPRFVRE